MARDAPTDSATTGLAGFTEAEEQRALSPGSKRIASSDRIGMLPSSLRRETGFLKKAPSRLGSSGSIRARPGRIDNCHIGVFLAYAGRQGTRSSTESCTCPRAEPMTGHPDGVEFHTKPQLARSGRPRAGAGMGSEAG
jgi:hypothetical protein